MTSWRWTMNAAAICNTTQSGNSKMWCLFRRCLFFYFLFGGANLIHCVDGRSQYCEVETGQTNIILDIEESRGTSIGQRTTPGELPIFGDPLTEIALELVFPKGNAIFMLNGKTLQLLQPLDRDEENLSHIVFQISCTVRATRRKRNIPIIVRVSDVNDNAPAFINTPYETTVPESTPVGTTIFRNIQAIDKDAGVNGLVEYTLIEGNYTNMDEKLTSADGYGTFSIAFPHQGQVTVIKTLDYERIQRYYLTVVASDRSRNASEKLSATTTITINVADSDDLDPSFIYRGCVLLDGACINPEYSASVPSGSLQGVLSVSPERIQAVDLDTLSSPIRYSFESGIPGSFADYFEIDEQTGVLKQIKVVDTTIAKKFEIVVKAEEVSEMKRFTTAKLTITIKPVDANAPVIKASSPEGFVDENSPIGTKVLSKTGHQIRFIITDADLADDDPKPDYIYELTTPSFKVADDGLLLVNEEELDRDPPNSGQFKFQIVAREALSNAASAPLSFTVTLNDINDNPPKLVMVPPVTVAAGDGRRFVTKVTATDNDAGENAVITYSIFHVSNNGAKKFAIDENTGEIETRTKMRAGEQYSITVQATDIGGLQTQAIVEVTVSPGPNTKPPKFVKPVYDVQVSEGAEINSTVTVVKAEDPESDPVRYSITSGNDLRQFAVSHESGVISVIRKLDREDLTRYQLIVKAEDNGGLASSATVNIKVTDINDNNPEFPEDVVPYTFSVQEGREDATVGTIHATDADEGVNAEITYTIPSDIPFKIDPKTGEIRTKSKLDFETQKEYKFVVTAKDGAPDMRLGTASVVVKVLDVEDEVPEFKDARVEVKVPENVPDLLITTVKAEDPDTVKMITYVLRQGPGDLFKVDAKTGQVKTVRGLDYEKEKTHELIVGTVENNGNGPGDTIKIYIDVDDRNDIPPVFVSVPEPVSVTDDQPIGTIVGSMPAIDGDGSSPGNVVRYEIVGRGKAQKYFTIDSDTGTIRLRDLLYNEDDTEYQVDVRAYDMGEPQLSSVATLPVFVRHLINDAMGDGDDDEPREIDEDSAVITNPQVVGLGFGDDSYSIEIPEMAKVNSTIKSISISKKSTKNNTGFKCEIVKGNEMRLFRVAVDYNACKILLDNELDYENKTSHEITLVLRSNKYFVNPQQSTTKLKIIVQDQNDNAPQFMLNKNLPKSARNDTYYAVANNKMDFDMPILQVRAIDRDTGNYGIVKYRIFDEESNDIVFDQPSTYFTMTEDSGILKLQKSLENVPNLPIKFFVEARDNNGIDDGSMHQSKARIIVNLISDINRMSLVFSDSSPKELRNHTKPLEELLSEKTDGLIAGIERLSVRRYLDENGTIMENPDATDVWFYVIDPHSELILPRNSSEVDVKLLKPAIQSQINYAASSLARATAQGIYAPLEPKLQTNQEKTVISGINNDLFPFVTIAIAVLILVLGTFGIVYICFSWTKYKNFKKQMRQYSAPQTPVRYDPVVIGSQTAETNASLKEYETQYYSQVLAMAVPQQEEQDDMQIDFGAHKNHAFSLDSVSYITHKENNGQSSPNSVNSDATTAIVTTLHRNNNNNINNINNNNRQNTLNRTLEMNRNNANPLAMGAVNTGTLPGTLTLGRLKSERNNIINGYGDSMNRNNLAMAQNNTFSTLGRNGGGGVGNSGGGGGTNTYNRNQGFKDLSTSTLGRNKRYTEMPIQNPLFARPQNGDVHQLNHVSTTNDNVTFGKRDFNNPLGFSYINDLDRSEIETTTEL